MTISGFTYIRNGFTFGYPFLESIQSALPLCDEFVVAVGDSHDGTREAVAALGPKIRIIDTVWDEQLRQGGKIFAQQSNIALAAIQGDWALHLQADELLHEQDLDRLRNAFQRADQHPKAEGLLLDFLNFYGSYDYLNDSRRQHRREIRAFRNSGDIFSYRDSQGFRRYPNKAAYQQGHKGKKINVLAANIPVYHYSYVRPPEAMQAKSKYFERFWHQDEYLQQKYTSQAEFDYYNLERVKRFTGKHPAIMQAKIDAADWGFDPAKLHKKLSLKEKIAYWLEDRLGRRLGEYKNYILV